MSTSKERLWTKDFILVSSTNFLLTLVFYLLMVTIALFAVNNYQATTSQAGLVTGIFIIGTLFGRLIIGRAIDAIGRKRTLSVGMLLFSLTTLLYFIDFGISFLLFTRLVHGLTLGIASTALGTIVAQTIPITRKGEGIGYFSMSTTLATAIGPFIGLYLSQHTSFPMIFIFCLALGIIGLVLSFFVKVSEIQKEAGKVGLKLSQFIEPKALPIALVTLTIALCYSSVLSFINFYALEIDLVKAASFFFIVYSIAVLLSRPFTGRLMDLRGANIIMYPAFILLAVGLFILSKADNTFMLLLSGALIGLGFGNIQSCTQAISIKLTTPARMGLATSTFFIFLDIGLGIGPYILGFIIPVFGYEMMYFSLGFVSLAAIMLYYFMHGIKDKGLSERATA